MTAAVRIGETVISMRPDGATVALPGIAGQVVETTAAQDAVLHAALAELLGMAASPSLVRCADGRWHPSPLVEAELAAVRAVRRYAAVAGVDVVAAVSASLAQARLAVDADAAVTA